MLAFVAVWTAQQAPMPEDEETRGQSQSGRMHDGEPSIAWVREVVEHVAQSRRELADTGLGMRQRIRYTMRPRDKS